MSGLSARLVSVESRIPEWNRPVQKFSVAEFHPSWVSCSHCLYQEIPFLAQCGDGENESSGEFICGLASLVWKYSRQNPLWWLTLCCSLQLSAAQLMVFWLVLILIHFWWMAPHQRTAEHQKEFQCESLPFSLRLLAGRGRDCVLYCGRASMISVCKNVTWYDWINIEIKTLWLNDQFNHPIQFQLNFHNHSVVNQKFQCEINIFRSLIVMFDWQGIVGRHFPRFPPSI